MGSLEDMWTLLSGVLCVSLYLDGREVCAQMEKRRRRRRSARRAKMEKTIARRDALHHWRERFRLELEVQQKKLDNRV